jgi:peptide deformylase
MKIDIVKYGDEILRKVCKEAINNEFTKNVTKDLKDTLILVENGAGLAAPQIGIDARVFATRNYRDDKRDEILIFINPTIEEFSKETVVIPDGCLSIPNIFSNTKRHSFINVTYLDEKFNKVSEELEGFQSVVFQHELDHLNGVLFIDLLSEEEKLNLEVFLERKKREPNIAYIEGKIIEINLEANVQPAK